MVISNSHRNHGLSPCSPAFSIVSHNQGPDDLGGRRVAPFLDHSLISKNPGCGACGNCSGCSSESSMGDASIDRWGWRWLYSWDMIIYCWYHGNFMGFVFLFYGNFMGIYHGLTEWFYEMTWPEYIGILIEYHGYVGGNLGI